MPNKQLPDEIKEKIKELSEKDYAISRIAKLTNTSRPTVRKYANIQEENNEG